MERFSRLSEQWLFFRDPPEHGEIRSAMQRAFTPRAVEELRPGAVAEAERLIEALAVKHEADLVGGLAHPLAASGIARFLCGAAGQREDFLSLCRDLAAGSEAPRDPATRRRGFRAIAGLAEYVETACTPGAPNTSFLQNLLAALGPEGAGAQALVLVFAGIETTQNWISSAIRELLRSGGWPLAQAELAPALEQCLLSNPPVLGVVRRVREDLTLAGQLLRAGEEALVMTAAADREGDSGPHLAFGHGVHYCLGAALARMEAAVAVEALGKRFAGLRLADEPPAWYDHDPIVRGLKRLPVVLR
jgi:cytochrome P450